MSKGIGSKIKLPPQSTHGAPEMVHSSSSRQNLRQITTAGPIEAIQSADSTYGLLRVRSVHWQGLWSEVS